MPGHLTTIMALAGLNCGTPSSLGWPILRDTAEAFLSCEDEVTTLGMRLYYYPIEGMFIFSVSKLKIIQNVIYYIGDPQIISGESGAVTLGALYLLCTKARWAHIT